MENSTKEVVCAFTGGGTGGHIYPGLAVADALKSRISCKIVWLGSSSGMDKSLVEKSGSCDRFIGISSGKLRRYFSFKNCIDLFKIAMGFIKAFFVLFSVKPQFLFSKGGFVSVPPCFAARLLHIPVYTHECDFSPGLATRLNARFANRIFVSYEETVTFFPAAKRSCITVTGNPVRPVFYSAQPELGYAFLGIDKNTKDKPILLVLGGSGGAKQINELVWQNIEWLCERFIVVHQTGAAAGNMADAQQAHNALQKLIDFGLYMPYTFIYGDMPHVLACADVIFSRSGANSLWEAATLNKPMVLLPLSGSGTRGDQVENAAYFAEKDAAIVIKADGSENDSAGMKKALEQVLDSDCRENLSIALKFLCGNRQPAAVIADILKNEVRL